MADGYLTACAQTVKHARTLAFNAPPTLVVLGNLHSPHSALELLAEIRDGDLPWEGHLPVIVLGSSSCPLDLLRAFDAGADDFLARSGGAGNEGAGSEGVSSSCGGDFDYLELRARLRSLLRRAAHASVISLPRLRVGPLAIDGYERAVFLHEHPIRLRPREYALLLHLAREPNRVFPRHDLLRAVWGYEGSSRTRTLDSHACRLRGKLALHSTEQWVINVRCVGYRLTA